MRRLFTATFLASLLASLAPAQETGFIEGFPDVPQLDVVRGMEGEPIFFDTAVGTVAETTLLIEGGGDNAMKAYSSALTGLGWQCTAANAYLRCIREENRLVFFDPNPAIKNGKLILRLEPNR